LGLLPVNEQAQPNVGPHEPTLRRRQRRGSLLLHGEGLIQPAGAAL
jgi:hypothetical protein